MYTQGPWTQCAPEVGGVVEESYRTIIGGDGFHSEKGGFALTGFINEADAKLISAAPDLLNALTKMLACCYDTERDDETFSAWKMAISAIHKAVGDEA